MEIKAADAAASVSFSLLAVAEVVALVTEVMLVAVVRAPLADADEDGKLCGSVSLAGIF